jgi:hypothetical protein
MEQIKHTNYPSADHVTPKHLNGTVQDDHTLSGIYYARKYPHSSGLQYDIMRRVDSVVQAWTGSAVSYECAIRMCRALNEHERTT